MNKLDSFVIPFYLQKNEKLEFHCLKKDIKFRLFLMEATIQEQFLWIRLSHTNIHQRYWHKGLEFHIWYEDDICFVLMMSYVLVDALIRQLEPVSC